MAVAASLLRSEMRRHLLMNVGLVASCVVGATVVTNERGLFVPLGIHSMSETAKAFAAMFTPSTLLPGFVNVQMVTPLEPFDVTADSRDLRRRLMEESDATGLAPDTGSDVTDPSSPVGSMAQYSNTPISPTELGGTKNGGVGESHAAADGGSGGGGSGGGSGGSGSGSAPTQVASSTPTGTPGGTSNGQTGNQASRDTFTPGQPNVTSALAATNDDTVTTNTTGGGGDTTTAVPEPSMWLMMLAGFGAVGYALRAARRRRADIEAEAA